MSFNIKNFSLILLAFLPLFFFGCTNSVSTKIITLHDHHFTVELATTEAERERGLMWRTTLPADHGMLFVFEQPEQVSFWMKNTLIPLDILYFDAEQKLVQIYGNTPPCKPEPVEGCQSYPSNSKIKYALEVPADTAKKIGVKIGEAFMLN